MSGKKQIFLFFCSLLCAIALFTYVIWTESNIQAQPNFSDNTISETSIAPKPSFNAIRSPFKHFAIPQVLSQIQIDALSNDAQSHIFKVIESNGGLVEVTDDNIKVQYQDYTGYYFKDNSYYILDNKGNGEGNVIIETSLSGMIPNFDGTIDSCVVVQDAALIKYRDCFEVDFASYCEQVQEIFNHDVYQSDSLFVGHNGEYTLSVLFEHYTMSIQIQKIQKED